MTEPTRDLRESLDILRGRRAVVGLAAGAGLLAGIVITMLWPALVTSQALVVLPAPTRAAPDPAAIVTRPPVLSAVLRRAAAAQPLDSLPGQVRVSSLSAAVISITAAERTSAQARQIAGAVAGSLVSYLGTAGDADSGSVARHVAGGMVGGAADGGVPARMVEPATVAAGLPRALQLAFDGIAGLLAGGLAGAIGAIACGRRRSEPRRPDAVAAGLVGLGALGAVLRRHARLWCGTGVAGLLLGSCLYLGAPPLYQASVSILVAANPYPFANPAAARADDLAWSRSAAVARAAVRELRSRPSAGSMLSQYTAAFVSGQVLQMTVSAPLASQAVRRANVLGAVFLRTRATLLGAEAQLEVQAASRQIARLSRRAAALAPLVASAAKAATSPARLRALRRLRARYYRATSAEAPLRRQATAAVVSATSMMAGSKLVEPATPLPRSPLAIFLSYLGGGLIGGLTCGAGLVVARALGASRRKARGQPAAPAGAPARLSAGRAPVAG